ncbi:probable aminotransferase TAT2 isoform X2 [Manihot esculenta]|uniref:Uncharacterized protein n=1 Tax=Manihot esculenta TaxID=3983 RepID=A0ACB7GPE2_MANES|nr:probable aminotransferase TAT2 isoform X2 [Manihot esculenta]KAG8641358.1 hypothetical protein MANES_13G143400v8 [Manihot esculenta]
MENGSKKWGFQSNKILNTSAKYMTVRGALDALMANLNKQDQRPLIPLGNGDPSTFPCFRTTSVAEDAIVDALKSAKYNCYAPKYGILPARRAIADHLNCDLPYKLSPDDVFVTLGCIHAIEITVRALVRPGANILFPRPGFPYYEVVAEQTALEIRHFDLLPEKGWEVDLEAVEALADENTVGMVIINPGNPCGNVYSYGHLKEIAETAKKLGIMVIADEVYGHLSFGSTPYVRMGIFGSIVPILSLGSISKRWIVPGWRIGWIVAVDPNGILKSTGVVDSILNCLNICSGPPTFIQAAIPEILENTEKDFFMKIVNLLREDADICCDRMQDNPYITCPKKPEGSMFLMAKLNISLLEDIKDDMDFCLKLAKEESVIILPVQGCL